MSATGLVSDGIYHHTMNTQRAKFGGVRSSFIHSYHWLIGRSVHRYRPGCVLLGIRIPIRLHVRGETVDANVDSYGNATVIEQTCDDSADLAGKEFA